MVPAVKAAIVVSLLLATVVPAYPHGGGLDSYGCHHNRKAGGYHCHRGEFAGQSFTSQQEMFQKLKGQSKQKPASKDVKEKKE
jgi:hypothetical protein